MKADGLVYVAGTIVPEGDIKAQTKAVIESMSQVLQKAGSSLANVASVHVYLTKADDFAAMNEVYRTFWPKDPPVRTTIVSDLVLPGGLVEMSMVAVPNGGERAVIHPSDWMKSPNPYSYGIRSGDTLFLAGLVSRNGKDNSVVEGDMSAQTKTVLDNAGQILKAAGMSFDNVVSSRVFITDQTKFQEMNKVYTTYFTKDPPARATVVAPLMGAAVSGRNHAYRVEAAEAGVHDAGGRRLAGQAEPDPEQRHQGRQQAVCVGHPRQHAGDQGQHRGANRRALESRRPDVEGRRLRLDEHRRRHRLHHRRQELRCDEQGLPHDLHERLPVPGHGPHRPGECGRAGRDHVRGGEVGRVGLVGQVGRVRTLTLT